MCIVCVHACVCNITVVIYIPVHVYVFKKSVNSSIEGSQTKASLQHFLNKDTFLTQWLHQQQNTTSGDTRQLAAMVMGTTPSLTSNASLSESLTVSQSQKLPSDPSVLRCYEDERAKGNTLLRKVLNIICVCVCVCVWGGGGGGGGGGMGVYPSV